MAGYYELPVSREYVGNYGGLNGNVYGPPPPMPYGKMQGLCMPVPMYRGGGGAVPKVANPFPQSMFARERDGYLRDRLEGDNDDEEEDAEPIKTQKDRPRHNRASKLDDDDEDFEPVKIPVRSRHTRASYLNNDEDVPLRPIKTSSARPRYSAACLDDDGDAEPVMKLEDIEEDLRKLREATSSVLNRFTAKSNNQPSTRYLNDDYDKKSYTSNSYSSPSSFSSSYVRPSSIKPVESSTYEPPVYDKRHSMYLSSRSTNKEMDLERSTAGKSDQGSIPQETVPIEPESYSRRRPRVSSEDTSKINSRIAVMSKYILSKNKTKN